MFGHQALDAELPLLAQKYGPPNGRALLAWRDGEAIAGGAFRRHSATDCELKRLFVTDRGRGRRLGHRLTEALCDQARADGYTTMKLDTADRMAEALALYDGLGFRRIPPYLEYPPHLAGHIVFMEKALQP